MLTISCLILDIKVRTCTLFPPIFERMNLNREAGNRHIGTIIIIYKCILIISPISRVHISDEGRLAA